MWGTPYWNYHTTNACFSLLFLEILLFIKLSAGFSVQEQLAAGGVLWFPDLTALDSTWILPVSLGVTNLLIVEIFALQKIAMSRFQTYMTYFMRAVSVLMIPVAATVPSSIVLYWLCSSFMGLSQNLLLRSPRFRQLCRIPVTKGDSDTPYKDLFAAFYSKFISRKWHTFQWFWNRSVTPP